MIAYTNTWRTILFLHTSHFPRLKLWATRLSPLRAYREVKFEDAGETPAIPAGAVHPRSQTASFTLHISLLLLSSLRVSASPREFFSPLRSSLSSLRVSAAPREFFSPSHFTCCPGLRECNFLAPPGPLPAGLPFAAPGGAAMVYSGALFIDTHIFGLGGV